MDATRLERVWVKKLRDATLDAIKGGSPDKDLDELVKWLDDIKIWRQAIFFLHFFLELWEWLHALLVAGEWTLKREREKEEEETKAECDKT